MKPKSVITYRLIKSTHVSSKYSIMIFAYDESKQQYKMTHLTKTIAYFDKYPDDYTGWRYRPGRRKTFKDYIKYIEKLPEEYLILNMRHKDALIAFISKMRVKKEPYRVQVFRVKLVKPLYRIIKEYILYGY